MKTLYLDCFSGASGDMLVGSLLDLGVKLSALEWELGKLDLPDDYHLHAEREERMSISGVKFTVHLGEHCHAPAQGHEHGHVHGPDCDHGHEHEHGHELAKERGPEHEHAVAHKHEEHGHDHGHEHKHEEHEHDHDHEHTHEEHGHDHGLEHKHEEHEHDRGHEHQQKEHGHDHGHEHKHEEHGHDHGHSHGDHGHAHGRTFREIRAMIEDSGLSAFVKKHSIGAFTRVAVAEGKVHGKPAEDVTFHEVGAVDSILDIVGFCIAVEKLGAPEIRVARLVEGSGFVRCAHGRFPLPAPATLEILSGVPFTQTVDEPCELLTPTGAALIAEFATGFGAIENFQVESVGYGLGTRHLRSRPNLVRAALGTRALDERQEAGTLERDTVVILETNLDDVPGEILGDVQARLFAAGALDVYLQPIQMKKDRPGVLLGVIAPVEKSNELTRLILRHTTAFGVRITTAERLKLPREIAEVATKYGKIQVKLGRMDGEIVQASPEYESCRLAAQAHSVSVREVYAAATQAARDVAKG